MMTKNHATMIHITFVAFMICTILLIACPQSLARADGGERQLPPRHPPPATPAIDHDDRPGNHEPLPGAYIELQTQAVPREAWTRIQWQDPAGGWHEVEG